MVNFLKSIYGGQIVGSHPNTVITFFYRMIFVPVSAIALFLVLPFHRKIRETLGLRMKPRLWPDWAGSAKILWIHAASGEFEYAKPLIKKWRQAHPDWKIYVTYFSPTYRWSVENFPGVDACGPLPLDLPGPMEQFVRKLKPTVLAVARTDLWPELGQACRRNKVPVILFSATRSALKKWEKWAAFAIRWRYQNADHILTVSDSDREQLLQLHLDRPIEALGDTRYDQVIERLANPKPVELPARCHAPVLICGSTWEPDEKTIIAASRDLLVAGRLSLILVPHEPTEPHLKSLERRLRGEGLESIRFSGMRHWDGRTVLLVDKVGILAELYANADLALVGGSFTRSVHSVMEPLAAGLVTIVGPYHRNNREAIEFQNEWISPGMSMVMAAKNTAGLKDVLAGWLGNNDRDHSREKIKAAVAARSAATERVAAYIDRVIQKN